MGLIEAFTSFFAADAWAEEPAQEAEDDSGDSGEESKEESSEEGGEEGENSEEGGEDGGEEGGEEGGDEEEEEEAEEDEEEEDEPEDIFPQLQEECAKTPACIPTKHEFDECVERVHKWEESDDPNKGAGEDCVEEYFEYIHCISQCAAPKLFKQLK